jgi:ferredoxin
VRGEEPEVDPALCINCGKCVRACPEGARLPLTDPWEAVQRLPFKVAVPSATLFSQFPANITPEKIVEGLLALGFDAVYPHWIETELVNMAIRDYLDESRGPYPLISSSCPAVVRLVEVAYPHMAGQVIPVMSPREIAGRELKRLCSERNGCRPEEIAVVYIAPCPSKAASVRQPTEQKERHLDLAIGISEIYKPLLTAITQSTEPGGVEVAVKSRVGLAWASLGGESQSLQPGRHISVYDLAHVIRVLDDIGAGKIRGVEFVECWACTAGCVGGPLAVDEAFTAASKIQKLVEQISAEEARQASREARRRYVKGSLLRTLMPRSLDSSPLSFKEQFERSKVRNSLAALLPGIDCGLCGAPTCDTFAEDVAAGRSRLAECVIASDERVGAVRRRHEAARARLASFAPVG